MLGFGDARDLKCNTGQASGRAAALPVDDQRGKRAVVWEKVSTLMRYRS